MPNYLTTSGRMTRRGWWLHSTIGWIIGGAFLVYWVTAHTKQSLLEDPINLIVAILPLVWIQFALMGKRLHDQDKSAWFSLWALFPYIGTAISGYYCGIRAGTIGPNRFGPDPRKPKTIDGGLEGTETLSSPELSRSYERMMAMVDRQSGSSSASEATSAAKPMQKPSPHTINRHGRPAVAFGKR